MNCDEARKRMDASLDGPANGALRDHLGGCAGCRDYRERALAARSWFRTHCADVQPDAAFAARVAARLEPRDAADALGWAAARLLPATVALVAVLGWFAFQSSPDLAQDRTEVADDDLLTWLIDQDGSER